jgi:hypothetical protein
MRLAVSQLLHATTIGTTLIRPSIVPPYSRYSRPVNHQSVTSSNAAAKLAPGRKTDPDRTASTAEPISGGTRSPMNPVSHHPYQPE